MESNKLIAEFMGVKPTILGDEITYEMYGAIDCIEDGVDEQHFFLEEQLLFHTSWDWLMPVVERINLQVTLGHATGNIHKLIDKIHHIVKYAMKDATYKAVVEFINQHNKTI